MTTLDRSTPSETSPAPTMDRGPIILFDGVCNLCAHAVQFVLRRDAAERYTFASLQSEAARELLDEIDPTLYDVDSIVLIEDGAAHVRSGAALRIARRLTGAWPLMYGFMIVPRPLRDWAYDLVARNRYRWFGKADQCMVPLPALRARFLDANEPRD